LTYLAAALRTITPAVEEWVSGVLQSPQPPSAEVVLTVLLNEITAIPDDFVLVLDDYHVIDAQPADAGLTFLIAAQQHGQQAILLAQPIANTDRFIPYKIFLARVKLAQGETAEAAVILSEAMQFVRQHNFGNRIPEVAAAQVLVRSSGANARPSSLLGASTWVQGDLCAALAILEPLRRQMEAKAWADRLLKVMVLEALAL
jgi:hypothetical protein